MNCQDINQNIYDYCDAVVAPDLHSTMAEHINECESCRNNYMLTLIENEVLRDTGDIPLLAPAFTARVISSIVYADGINSMAQTLVISKSSSPYFKRTLGYSGLAIVAAVIALCLYLPNLKNMGNNINVADNSIKQAQLELQSKVGNSNDYGTQAKNDDTIKLSQVSPPGTLKSKSNSVPIYKDMTVPPSVLSASESPVAMKRSTNPEIGISNCIESAVSDTATLAYSPQNIPARFKLVKLDNTAEKETVYNYVSQDGKENLQLKVAPYREKMLAIGPTSNITTQDSPPSLTRDIQVGDQKITLTISGNIPTEELTQLANTIKLN